MVSSGSVNEPLLELFQAILDGVPDPPPLGLPLAVVDIVTQDVGLAGLDLDQRVQAVLKEQKAQSFAIN